LPVIPSSFHAPALLRNGHLQTILPALAGKAKRPAFTRERLELSDGDFLDLDWLISDKNSPLFILCHGLEGSSDTNYINRTAAYLNNNNFNILAWNYRGCSGEMNRRLRFYHSGETGDLHTIIYLAAERGFHSIILAGFSLGGNVVLKYAGEKSDKISALIKNVIAISAPIDLAATARQLHKPSNRVYLTRFLQSLKNKIRGKAKLYPDKINLSLLKDVRDFYDYDDAFTAPIHGFKNAVDYYAKSSSKQFLKDIAVPTLMIQPLNDPFLPIECYPVTEAEFNDCLYLEMPFSGGHLGYLNFSGEAYYPAVSMKNFITQK
jgi:predicted alpha/beta-fold hydrolase